MVKILRWIAVLPAAIAGSLLGYAAVQLLSMLLNGRTRYLIGDGMLSGGALSWQSLVSFIFANAVFGFVFVYAGVYTAPAYKKITSIVLTVVLAILIGVSITLSLMTGLWWEVAIASLIVLASAIAACVKTTDEGLELDE